MNYLISKYKLFESEINDIIKRCKKYNIEKYEIDDDGQLTVFGDVYLTNKSFKIIPFKFKEVYGDFAIANTKITTLFGSPSFVGGRFYISHTKIKNLEFAPIEVEGNLECNNNKDLINIRHFPKYIGRNVVLYHCENLKSLYGCLRILYNSIDLYGCWSLKSLKYGPHEVNDSYFCTMCNLISLYGAPKFVGDTFNCAYNKLTSLKYSPKYIGGDFIFTNNDIRSFQHFPEYVDGDIMCHFNPVYNIWVLFEDKRHIEYFNDMKIINDKEKKINIKKLNAFLYSIGKKSVKSVDDYENI